MYESGVDSVKFQTRSLPHLFRSSALVGETLDLGAEYTLDLLQKYNLEFSYQQELFDYAHSLGLIVGSTPWDSQSAKFLNQDVISYIKVSSADLTNIPLITEVSKFGKPLILSTGMSTEEDILSTVEHLTSTGSQFVILHCNSTYPCPYEDINLSYVNRLKGNPPAY